MLDLFSGRGQFAGLARVGIEQLKPWLVISRLWGHIFLTERLPLGIGVGTVCLLIFWKKYFRSLLNWWLIAGTFGVSFYEGIMHDHYLGFLFPVPFLIFGAAVATLIRVRELRWLITVLVFVLVFLSFWQTDLPQKNNGDKQIERTKIVADVIAGDVGEKRFNLAIKSVTGDFLAMNYRYFLEYFGKKPEEYGDFKSVEQLYVIEEKDWDDPGRLGLWETGAFGPYKIGGHWHFDFQKELYRLDRQE
jgi:hypothetical protein